MNGEERTKMAGTPGNAEAVDGGAEAGGCPSADPGRNAGGGEPGRGRAHVPAGGRTDRARMGLTRSVAFVAQPQTNGIAERFIKTLKQQSLYGRIFRNTQEAAHAFFTFAPQDRHQQRIERLGFLTPAEARTQVLTPEAA